MAAYEVKARGKLFQSETPENNHSVSSKGEIFQRRDECVIARV